MVSLGATVDDRSFVEMYSVVAEGAVVPPNSSVGGNRATRSGDFVGVDDNPEWLIFGCCKMIWLFAEMGYICVIVELGDSLWLALSPRVQHMPVVKFTFLLYWLGFVSILVSIVMKWALIGKRKAGCYNDTILRRMTDWAVDFHYRAFSNILLPFSSNSKIWNVILLLHGTDIDFQSTVQSRNFVPSQMDLVKLRKSFVSLASFSLEGGGRYGSAIINNSSLGFLVNVSAAIDQVVIDQSIIPPFTQVTRSMRNEAQGQNLSASSSSLARALIFELQASGLYIFVFGLFVIGTLVPSYELYQAVSCSENTLLSQVIALAAALLLHTSLWTILLGIVQHVAQIGARQNRRPWNRALYVVYLTMQFAHQKFSLVRVFHGSSSFNLVVRALGGRFLGRAILFPRNAYEYSFIEFGDRAIVSNADVNGHYFVNGEMVLGPSRLSGVIHDGCYTTNAAIEDGESGPWRMFIGNYPIKQPAMLSEPKTKAH